MRQNIDVVSLFRPHEIESRESRSFRRTSQFSRSHHPSLIEDLELPQLALKLPDLVLGLEDECDLGLRRVGVAVGGRRKGDGSDGEEGRIKVVCGREIGQWKLQVGGGKEERAYSCERIA